MREKAKVIILLGLIFLCVGLSAQPRSLENTIWETRDGYDPVLRLTFSKNNVKWEQDGFPAWLFRYDYELGIVVIHMELGQDYRRLSMEIKDNILYFLDRKLSRIK
jgi:hypothetical protein